MGNVLSDAEIAKFKAFAIEWNEINRQRNDVLMQSANELQRGEWSGTYRHMPSISQILREKMDYYHNIGLITDDNYHGWSGYIKISDEVE